MLQKQRKAGKFIGGAANGCEWRDTTKVQSAFRNICRENSAKI
jgi:hypothetical protein